MNIDVESSVKFIFFIEIFVTVRCNGTNRSHANTALRKGLHIHSERVSGSARSFVTFILGPDSKRRLSRFIDRKRWWQRAPWNAITANNSA